MLETQPLKIYADRSGYRPELRPYLNDVMRAFWEHRPLVDRLTKYGVRAVLYEYVEEITACDLVFLPFNWMYYLERGLFAQAEALVTQARQSGKPMVIFSQSDYTANLPFQGVTLFEQSAYRSRRAASGNQVFAMPAFIGDYARQYQLDPLPVRPKSSRPVVGFCGQAGGSAFDFLYRELVNRYRRLAFRRGWRRTEPAPFETTRFRRQVLDTLAASPLVETNFLIRRRYGAGLQLASRETRQAAHRQFVQNILDSDYTVCMRGGGNFSVRFYETLCLGRIPIFVDTDCVLPWDDQLDYRRYCVWVDQAEISHIAEKVADCHAALVPTDFVEWQHTCRKLWTEYLFVEGFYHQLVLHLRQNNYA
jgi:hypothetical protein